MRSNTSVFVNQLQGQEKRNFQDRVEKIERGAKCWIMVKARSIFLVDRALWSQKISYLFELQFNTYRLVGLIDFDRKDFLNRIKRAIQVCAENSSTHE